MKKYVALSIMAVLSLQLSAFSEGITGPKAINYVEVISKMEYPKVCKEKGIEGTVIVELNISKHGEIQSYEISKYPNVELKVAVEELLNELKFTPAKNYHGDSVDGKVILPINFKLTI